MLGIDGSICHVTEIVDGGEEVLHDRRRESVGEEKEVDDPTKEATGLGAAGQLTGAFDDARQET